MKKLLFHLGALGRGGAERVMVNLARQFRGDGYEVVFVTTTRKSPEYPADGFKRIVLDEICTTRGVLRNPAMIKTLVGVIKAEKPDVVLSFLSEPISRILVARLFAKFTSVVSVRNDPEKEFNTSSKKLLRKTLLPFVSGAVFQTPDAMKQFPAVLQKKSAVIPNPVSDAFYGVESAEKSLDIVTVGRLTEQKNHTLLFEAFSKISKEFPETRLVCYGDGPLKDKLNEKIHALGMDGRIILAGEADDIPSKISSAAIFVLSSDYEGLPNALMEAMALGLCAVSTDCPCGGPRYLIKDGENGCLVPVGDVNALAEKLRLLLSEPEYAEKLGKNAAESAERFKSETVYRQWKEFLLSKCG